MGRGVLRAELRLGEGLAESVPRGRLIAFEGGEASGKTTQARLLSERLGALLTFEPGATSVGRSLRSLLLGGEGVGLCSRAEALLMLADRAQHVDEAVAPALSSGKWVVTDRFSFSTLAYQGYGRRLSLDELRSLCTWSTSGLWPDLNVLLLVSANERRRRSGAAPDRLEAEPAEFHRLVEDGYRELASTDPERWVVVEGDDPTDKVAERVFSEVKWRLGDPCT